MEWVYSYNLGAHTFNDNIQEQSIANSIIHTVKFWLLEDLHFSDVDVV